MNAGEREVPFVLGTAGHIDHGKTTLVKALTGIDCDRLQEEKKRGITIELGFAPLRLPGGAVVSIVDVPGHERFIRQMVAGASGVDAVLFVVAADEGVMPQTREHLAILSLLGVRDGVVALTKADLVDPEMLELVREDVAEALRGTFLESAPVFAVSAHTGENLDLLTQALESLVERVPPRDRSGGFFLPVDRAFPISGFGTVVTGTAYTGTLRSGSDVVLLPSERAGKVRTLQVHGRLVEEAWAGQRIAVNLSGVPVDAINRGDVLCSPGMFVPTSCLDVVLRVLASSMEPVKHWQRVHLHVGTSDTLARVALLDRRQIEPGEDAPAQLVLEERIVACLHQRFVVRFYSPLVTIAGGEILYPYGIKPRGRKARTAVAGRIETLLAAPGRSTLFALLANERTRISLREAMVFLQQTAEEVRALAKDLVRGKRLVVLGKGNDESYVSTVQLKKIEALLLETLDEFHAAMPQLRGMPLEQLVARLFPGEDVRSAKEILSLFLENGTVLLEEGRVRTPRFVYRDPEELRRHLRALEELCARSGVMQLPLLEEVRHALHLSEQDLRILMDVARQEGLVTVISEGMLLHRVVEERLLGLLGTVESDITVASVRDLTGSSRKYVLPILEHFDARGYTRRVGDKRILRKKNIMREGEK